MNDTSSEGSSTQVSKIIKAPRHTVYQAFLEPGAVSAWLAPGTMKLHMHTFDPKEGGKFRISLSYQDPEDSQRGKTTGNTDTYHGYFVKLIPDTLIIEAIEFETEDPKFAGEMTMTARFADVEGGTEVSLFYGNVPAGVRPEDNEMGSRQSLEKLAALVE